MMVGMLYTLVQTVLLFILVHRIGADNPEILSFDFTKPQLSSRSGATAAGLGEWTPERMRAAEPINSIANTDLSSGKPGIPSGKSLLSGNGPFTVIEPATADNKVTKSRLISPNNQAVTTAGKVFFRTPSGDSTCSGSVVTAPSGCLVVTAAHCLYDLNTRSWYTNWIFVPDYDDGAAPLGIWYAKYAQVLQAYSISKATSPNWNYDVAFVVMNRLQSYTIQQITGSQGIVFNANKNLMTYTFGYPANIANAAIMSACISRSLPPTCNVAGYTGQALRCGMGGGCSEGPWILNFNITNGLGYIGSVNSYTCTTSTNMMHGPYFDSNTKSLYDGIKNLA